MVGLGARQQHIRELSAATANLSVKNRLLALSAAGVSKEDAILVLESQDVEQQTIDQTLATSNLSFAQAGATGTTISWSKALEGLKLKLKSFAAAHPVLLAIAAAIAAIGATAVIIDATTTSVEEQQEQFEQAKEKYEEVSNELQNLQDELKTTTTRIEELQDKSNTGTITLVEQDELVKLKESNELLKEQILLKQQEERNANKSVAQEAVNTYKKLNGGVSPEEIYKNSFVTGTEDEFLVGNFMSYASGNVEAYEFAIKNIKNEIETHKQEIEDLQKELSQDGADTVEINYQISYNETVIERYKKALETLAKQGSDLAKDKITEFSEYREALISQMNIDGTFDDSEFQRIWDEIENKRKSSYKVSGMSGEWNTIKLDAIVEDSNLDGVMSQIQEKLNNGKITANDISGFTDLNDRLNNCNLILEDGQTATDVFIQYLNKLKTEGKSVADTTSDSFESVVINLNEALSKLTDNASLLSSVDEEISKMGRISADSIKEIAEAFPEDKYPEMAKALHYYQIELIDAQELFTELEKCYEQDKSSYLDELKAKAEVDETYYASMIEKYPDVFETLQTLYGNDVENWKSVAKAKLEIDNKLLTELGDKWKDYYEVILGDDDRYHLEEEIWDDSHIYHTNTAAAEKYNNSYDADRKARQEAIDRANAALDALDKISFRPIEDFDWETLGGKGSGSSSDKNNFDWIERVLNRISKAYTKLKNVVSDTTVTWVTRNDALVKSMAELEKEEKAQSKAAKAYMDIANSVKLDQKYKDLVAYGNYDVSTITDENLKDSINEYKEWYDKAIDAQIAAEEAARNWRSAAKEKFDGIKSDFDLQLGLLEDASNTLSKEQDILEENGYMASTYLYDALAKQEETNIELLKKEHEKLVNNLNEAVASGQVIKDSEDWYTMKTDINAVSSAIQDATLSLAQYNNESRQVKWDAFDKTREKVQQLVDESDFLYGLLEDEGLIDDETGVLNEYGNAVQALIAQKYNAYMNQADQYANAIAEIDKKILETPTDSKLIERKQELVEAQRDAINAAIDEKNAIKDLTSEAYDAYLSNLNDVIDKYKELMQTMKDAYDYEKQMSEKTENLAKLQKQYMAYQNDDSEAGMKMRQELGVQIEEAQEDIEQTEYEKMISDTEKLLDELSTETEAWIDERLENIDQTIEGVIQATNDNANIISDTLREVASSVGANLSTEMQSVWNNEDGQSVLTNYMDDFINQSTSLNEAVNSIAMGVQTMLEAANLKAKNSGSIPSYSTGTLHAKTYNGWAWTNEDGSELIRTSDGAILTRVGEGGTVFNSDMTNKLWEFANNPANFLSGLGLANVNVPEVKSSNTQNIDVGGFNIQVIANNPEEFAQQMKKVMANDKNAQKMIQEITLGQPFGKNSLNVHKYK